MNRGVLALFVGTMREENRRLMTYGVRFLLVLVALLVIGLNQREFRYGGGAPGLEVFKMVTMLNLISICVVGLGYFASAITEEKEDGTLGLLRMTNLNPLSILLGKSTSRLIGFLLLLLVQMPFITLAVALGGVSLNQVFSCYGNLAAFTFLLANLALVFSVMFRKTATAVSWTLGVLLFVFYGFRILGNLFQDWFGTGLGLLWLSEYIWQANPVDSMRKIFAVGFDETLIVQPVSNVAAGIVLFGLAWLIFDSFNHGEGRGTTPGAARRPRAWGRRTPSGPGASEVKPRPGHLAVTWREFYFQCGGWKRLYLTFFLTLILAGLFIAIGPARHWDLDPEEIGQFLMAFGLLAFFLHWVLSMASVFKHERKNKTWSSLSLLPESVSRIAYEKVLASFISTLPGLLVAGIGFLLCHDEISFDDDFFVLFAFFSLSWFVFGSHLVVYLSLFLKWGGLPVGLMVCVFFQFILALVIDSGMFDDDETIFVLWSGGLLFASCILHVSIGKRLEALAAEA